MFKRTAAALLAITLVFPALSLNKTAFDNMIYTISVCADDSVSGDYTYELLSDGTVSLTGYTGSATSLTLPATINGYTVSTVGVSAFSENSTITSLIIPGTIKTIKGSAFYKMTALKSVQIGSGVTTINDYAFQYCSSLATVTIPSSVTYIGGKVFSDTAWLTAKIKSNPLVSVNGIIIDGKKCTGSITVPSGTTMISSYAFSYNTSITSVSLPSSVTSIGNEAFRHCLNLTTINIGSNIQNFGKKCLYETQWITNRRAESDGGFVVFNGILIDAAACDANAVIPSTVVTIGSGSFDSNTTAVSVTIPSSVTTIENEAFSGCHLLKSITIPGTVETIGDGAFRNCDVLESVYICDGVKQIGQLAFAGNSELKTVKISNTVEEIPESCFQFAKKLESVTLPSNLKTIGNMAFFSCYVLDSVTFPEGLESIGDYAFTNCTEIKSYTIPSTVNYLGSYAIATYYLTNSYIAITDDVKILGYAGTVVESYATKYKIPFTDLTHKHSYSTSTVTKAATCTTTGTRTLSCSCGEKITQAINATGHSYKDTVIAPTFAAGGYTLHKCTVCGVSSKIKVTAKKTLSAPSTTTFTSSKTAVKINWKQVENAEGYIVYRYNSSTKKYEKAAVVKGATTLSYKDTGLKSAKEYRYKVKAYAKESGVTYKSAASKAAVTATKPETVKISKVTKSKTAVKLTWNKVSCTGYVIQQYDTTAKKWLTVKKGISSSTTSYKISGLTSTKTYKFRIAAYKTVSSKTVYSAWSEASS